MKPVFTTLVCDLKCKLPSNPYQKIRNFFFILNNPFRNLQNTQIQTQNPYTQKIENPNPDLHLWVLSGAYVWLTEKRERKKETETSDFSGL